MKTTGFFTIVMTISMLVSCKSIVEIPEITPRPVLLEADKGSFTIRLSTSISYNDDCGSVCGFTAGVNDKCAHGIPY